MTQELHDNVRGREHLFAASRQLRALLHVLRVQVAGCLARACLNQHVQPGLLQIREHRWHQCHAPLSGITFSGHTNDHVPSFLLRTFFNRNSVSRIRPKKTPVICHSDRRDGVLGRPGAEESLCNF